MVAHVRQVPHLFAGQIAGHRVIVVVRRQLVVARGGAQSSSFRARPGTACTLVSMPITALAPTALRLADDPLQRQVPGVIEDVADIP